MEKVRDKARTQRKILDAVGQIMHNDGIGKVTVALVAQVAGVNRMLVHRYFGPRDRLIECYFSERQRLKKEERDGSLVTSNDLVELDCYGSLESLLTNVMTSIWEDTYIQNELIAEITSGKLRGIPLSEIRVAELARVKSCLRDDEIKAMVAFICGAACHLGVLRATRQTFGDLDLAQEQSLNRFNSIIRYILNIFRPYR